MDGVAGCFERPLHINDGGSFTTVSSLYFSDSKAETNLQLHPAQKRKNDLMGDGIHFATQKRVSIRKLRKSVQQPFSLRCRFRAIVVRSMGRGSSRHLLRGSRVCPLIHRLTSRCRWKDNNFTLISGVCPNNFPLDGIRISVIFSFSLPARATVSRRRSVPLYNRR